MFVKYNKEGILSLPVPGGNTIILKPGVNPNINDEDWEKVAKNPVVNKKIENDIIVAMTSKLKTAKKAEDKKQVQESIQKELDNGASNDLAEYSAKEAIKLIEETYDVEMLKNWKYEEKRGKVVKSIEEQLSLIEKQGKSKS